MKGGRISSMKRYLQNSSRGGGKSTRSKNQGETNLKKNDTSYSGLNRYTSLVKPKVFTQKKVTN
jgi:hypothetical protein